jgi:carbonic anhydrase
MKKLIFTALIISIITAIIILSNKNDSNQLTYNEISKGLDSTKCPYFMINCIDYRFIKTNVALMDSQYTNLGYDNYIMVGASLGADKYVSPNQWLKSLQDAVVVATVLHKINTIVLIDHMDCGYFKIKYNEYATDSTYSGRRAYHLRSIDNFKRDFIDNNKSEAIRKLKFEAWLVSKDSTGNNTYDKLR